MGIRCRKDESRIEHILKNLKTLTENQMEVGIFASEGEMMLKIANAHEFGAHITPKNGKYLSIPLDRTFRDRSPREVPGLFVYRSKTGNLFLARKKGKKELQMCYWLTKEINIPERSFIRAGFDANRIEMEHFAEQTLADCLPLKDGIARFYDAMGNFAVGKIRAFLIDLRDPPNAPLTVRLKKSSNPLVDTGHLGDVITYRIRKR